MSLQDEYIARHKLAVKPVNYTLRSGSVPLHIQGRLGDSAYSTRQLILCVDWVSSDRRPGAYKVTFMKPIHDSYQRRDNFCLTTDPQHLEYEDFEPAVRSMFLKNVRAAANAAEASVFLWEMFVSCFDGWLAKNASPTLLSHIEDSIDLSFSMEKRFDGYLAASRALMKENPNAYEKWEFNFHSYRKKNLDWLACIMNGE